MGRFNIECAQAFLVTIVWLPEGRSSKEFGGEIFMSAAETMQPVEQFLSSDVAEPHGGLRTITGLRKKKMIHSAGP